MLKKTLMLVFVGVLVLAAVLTGCSDNTPTSTTTQTTTTSATTSSTATAEPTTGDKYGGIAKIIVGADVDSLGWPSDQISPEDYSQRAPAIETLVRWNEETNAAEPLLCESYTEDGVNKKITFKLRPNVVFHDGTPCDADAILWNLDQVRGSVNLAATFIGVESIEKVDESTIVLNFHTWDNTLMRNFCWDSAVISPTAYEEHGLDWIQNNPVGTGPFTLKNFQRDVIKEYERFDDYWDEGKPYIDGIEFHVIADPTVQVASYLAGTHYAIYNVNPRDALTLETAPNTRVTQGSVSGALKSIVGDSSNPNSPYANILVRQAVSHAIDKDTIVDFVFHGYAHVATQTNDVTCATHNPNVVGYPYNPEKAKELLAQAGYENGFTTTLWCRPDQIMRDTYTAVQGYLADVGIIADLQVLNVGQYGEMYWGTGWTDGLFATEMLADPEVGIQSRFFFSKNGCPGMATSMIHPDEVEAKMEEMTTAITFEAKKNAAWDLQTLMIDKYCMYTPLILEYQISVKSTKLHDDYVAEPQSSKSGSWGYGDVWLEK